MNFTYKNTNRIQFSITKEELLLLNSIFQEGRISLNCNIETSKRMEDEIRKACKDVFEK